MSEWIDVLLLLPDNDTKVIGCCDDDVLECHHTYDGFFEDCACEPITIDYWMPLPEPPK